MRLPVWVQINEISWGYVTKTECGQIPAKYGLANKMKRIND